MQASQFLIVWFIVLSGIVAVGAIAVVHFALERPGTTVRAAIVLACHLGVTALLAWAGALRFDTTPPTMLVLIAVTVAASVWLAFSQFGGELASAAPLAVLVGFQAFRFPLELLLHRAAVEGVMPVQMSYSGWNFDIVTGSSAFVVALALTKIRSPRARLALAAMWNVMGIVLLTIIVTVALLSTPTPIRVFHNEPPNDWIARFPFVWLPELFVALALLGHLLIFRRLRAETAQVGQ
jgi:hypothetical protein